jgi:hypothetical protein
MITSNEIDYSGIIIRIQMEIRHIQDLARQREFGRAIDRAQHITQLAWDLKLAVAHEALKQEEAARNASKAELEALQPFLGRV